MGALDHIRVIDLGQYVAGPVAGMLLADQGADVIRIDPPGGPVLDTPANATWNRGKQSICLDLHDADDLAVARRLVASADVLIENFRPGVMARLGLGEDALRVENPGLVYAAFPGFAASDARAAMPAWEGVVLAATDVFRPLAAYRDMLQVLHTPPEHRAGTPAFTAEPIASMYAAMIGVTGITAALDVRVRTGLGQRVEVPLFDAAIQAMGIFGMSRMPFRPSTTSAFSALDHQYRCRDGRWFQVVCTVPRHAERLLRAVGREDLIARGMTSRGLGSNPELNGELTEILVALFATRPAPEWERLFVAERLPGAMCRSTAEWLAHEHARRSDLLAEVEDPTLGPMRQPGLQVKLSATPGAIRGPAPLPDADREAILAELERPRPSVTRATREIHGLPLAGLRVLDLCIVLAGPTCGRTLAELGADVIKIDDPNRGQVVYHHDINRGKRTILLDLKTDAGLGVFWDLVERADVIVQNYRQGVVERLGIDYASVRKRKPDIVYASLNAYGDTGPWAELPGYEESVQALTGIQVRHGGDDVPLLWPYGVINDYGTGYAGAFGVLCALLVRARTGAGQHVTSALARTACTLQSAWLQDYAGKTWDEPRGPGALGFDATQRLYECADGWLYAGFKQPAQLEDLLGAGVSEDLAAAMAVWCRKRPVAEAVGAIVIAGGGAERLTWMNDAVGSEAATGRGLSVTRVHEKLGAMRTSGPGPWLSRSEIRPGVPAPLPGRDAASVLAEIGRADELDALVSAGVVRLP